MRKWCAILATGVLFALPLCAQQKDTGAASSSNSKSETVVATPASARDFSIAPASPSLFAMPAAAKPADIFSDWANNPWNRNAWGQLTPKFEVAGLFSYIDFRPGATNNFNNMGGTGSFAYNANKWLGLVTESLGAYSFKRDIYTLPTGATQQVLTTIKGTQQTYLFGPRLNLRQLRSFRALRGSSVWRRPRRL